MKRKSILVTYLLWFFLGLLGIHKFYLGKTFWGVVYLFTGGIFFIGWFIDLFTIPHQVSRYNAQLQPVHVQTFHTVDIPPDLKLR